MTRSHDRAKPPPGSGPASQTNKPAGPGEESSAEVNALVKEEEHGGVVEEGESLPEKKPGAWSAVKGWLVGRPLNLADRSLFRDVSLVAFLAWVGLGADGLSSSCYGPPESFAQLGEHASYLAIFLGLAIAATVFIISTCYSHIIEIFPGGGGGYLVASKLLGNRVGVISGCALLVDYVLTITVSISAAGDALFSLLGNAWLPWKLPCEYLAIVGLIVLNLRGVKESVEILTPIFILFLITHAVMILGAIGLHLGSAGKVVQDAATGLRQNAANPQVGIFGILGIWLYAYSMGSGTYTGLEAVSNSMPVMREPRVETAQRTMRYMAWSLAFMACGLIIAYLLLNIHPPGAGESQTMNGLLARDFTKLAHLPGWTGTAFVLAALISEGLLLIVAAQAGFIDGPRVLGYMAHDSWMPGWFANFSERLATHNGIVLMGAAALAALWYTGGNVTTLVLFYSINVFVTFSLSMIGMLRHWWQRRGQDPLWRRRTALFALGAAACVGILATNVTMKFFEGGWLTIAVTCIVVALAFAIHFYYGRVIERIKKLDAVLADRIVPRPEPNRAPPDRSRPTAIILVGRFGGLGVHTMLGSLHFVPDYFANLVFVSAGIIDSGNFKGSDALDALREDTQKNLDRYVELARSIGMPAASYMAIGTDAVDELTKLCLQAIKEFPHSTVFAAQLVFHEETWIDRLLKNNIAYSLLRRLQWAGYPMVILPCRVR